MVQKCKEENCFAVLPFCRFAVYPGKGIFTIPWTFKN